MDNQMDKQLMKAVYVDTEDDEEDVPVVQSTPTYSSGHGLGNNTGGYSQNMIGSNGVMPTLSSSSSSYPKKSKIRHVVVKADGTTLELREQPQITPREMIGISKLMSFISTAVYSNAAGVYNNISWSSLIVELAIENHFIKTSTTYGQDADVIEILLYDSH